MLDLVVETSIHDELTKSIFERLQGKQYDYLVPYEEYSVKLHGRTYRGEFDVLACRVRNGQVYWHYYEVKSSYNPRSVAQAAKQFSRAKQAHPNRNWKFILVTPKKICRTK